MDEASIERLAEEELLQEAKRGAARASVDGPAGWQRCPLPKTNKRFLRNTILHSLQSNRMCPSSRRSDADRRRRPHAEDSGRRGDTEIPDNRKRSDVSPAPRGASSSSGERKADATQRRPPGFRRDGPVEQGREGGDS